MFIPVLLPLLLAAQTPQPGHVLAAPFGSLDTYLVDDSGNVIHTWTGTAIPGNATYLKPNGNLVRMYKTSGQPAHVIGGSGGGVQELDFDGNVLWDYQLSTATRLLHHDMALMPNGHVLLLSFEDLGASGAQALGRDPATLDPLETHFWSEVVIELDPESLSIVWEWHAADHLVQDFDPLAPNFDVVADRPERLNLNYPPEVPPNADWTHCNAIDYHPTLDQVVISAPFLDEIWIIDHSTTTAEAAGSSGGTQGVGGDLLYRWGNPASYDRGTLADRTLWNQHDIHWIPDGRPGGGNLLVLNNGNDRPGGPFSSVDEIIPPLLAGGSYTVPAVGPFAPTAASWSWTDNPPSAFTVGFIGGAERQANGNTLIINGPMGRVFEVDGTGAEIWSWNNPLGSPLFKARKYQKYLFPGDATLSAATGGQIDFTLLGGSPHANRAYSLRARLTPGGPSLQRVLATGTLDAAGLATSTFDSHGPLPAAAIGRTMEVTWFTTAPNDFHSDVVRVPILP